VSVDLQSYAVATHEIDGGHFRWVSCGPNPSQILWRTLQLLRTIRAEGYTPHGAGTIAISERIEELEELLVGGGE